jgi:hypothetical protein
MTTTLLTLSLLLASPSAGPLTHADFATDAEFDAARAVARASSITLDADDLVSTPESWRPLLSAALCEAQDRVRDTEAAYYNLVFARGQLAVKQRSLELTPNATKALVDLCEQ